MPASGRWTDDGIDRLARQLDEVRPIVTEVAVLKRDMNSLTRAVEANTRATTKVTDQMEKAQMEPVIRGKRMREAIVVGLLCTVAGGTFGFILALIASSH